LKSNKTILITSGNSIVGNELISYFLLNNFKIIALYRGKFKKKKIKNLIQIKHNLIKSLDLRKKKIDIIVNSIATHEFSQNQTVQDYFDSNVLSILNIINYIKKNNKILVINLSTISIQKNIKGKIKEFSNYLDNTLLAITKFAGEKLFEIENINYINIRLPGVLVKNSIHLNRPWLNKIINNLKKNKKIKIFNLNKKFNHLVDVFEIFKFIKFLSKKKTIQYGTYNLCASGSMVLKNIIFLIKKRFNSQSKIINLQANNKPPSLICLKKTKKILGYSPTSLEHLLIRYLEE
jgi:nucleoside-diphosphate-sugar epimerase